MDQQPVLASSQEEKAHEKTEERTEEKTEKTEEKKQETEEKEKKPKRKNVKRKYLIEEEKEEKKTEKEEIEEKVGSEPQPKRIRVTSDEYEEEEPSFWRGGLIKPLLIAGLASASFFVNTMYKTSVPKATPPIQQKKRRRNKPCLSLKILCFKTKVYVAV